MTIIQYCGQDASHREKVICSDNSWYYGFLSDEASPVPHGFGAHYDINNNYLEGGDWEYGELTDSYTYEEYCEHEGIMP